MNIGGNPISSGLLHPEAVGSPVRVLRSPVGTSAVGLVNEGAAAGLGVAADHHPSKGSRLSLVGQPPTLAKRLGSFLQFDPIELGAVLAEIDVDPMRSGGEVPLDGVGHQIGVGIVLDEAGALSNVPTKGRTAIESDEERVAGAVGALGAGIEAIGSIGLELEAVSGHEIGFGGPGRTRPLGTVNELLVAGLVVRPGREAGDRASFGFLQGGTAFQACAP